MVVRFPATVIHKMHNLMSYSLNQAEVIPAHREVAEAHGGTILIHPQDKIRVAAEQERADRGLTGAKEGKAVIKVTIFPKMVGNRQPFCFNVSL